MTHVSRPLIALLLGTVVFFAVWTVALKPSSSTHSGGSSGGVGAYQSAIDRAHQAVKSSGQASAAHGGTLPTSSTTAAAGKSPAATSTNPVATKPATSTAATKPATATPTTTASATTTTPKPSAAQQRLSATQHAVDSGKVVALLFYNSAAADDRAVRKELAAVPASGNEVVKLEVPLSEAGKYTFITQRVQLAASPTLLVINRARQATTIVGFADRFEIAQRVADALAAPAK